MVNLSLYHGMSIPCIGLGTWQIRDRKLLSELLRKAYDVGYMLIDTAAAYSNEIGIAKAMESNGLHRDEIVLCDKVWNAFRGYEEVQMACRNSLKKLKTDYLDIYLIHWPAAPRLHPDWESINAETWRGMERLLQEGLVRAIGVSNFKTHHLEALKKTYNIKPMINQIEFHPGVQNTEIYDYCKAHDILIQASSPLGNGEILSNEELMELAKEKGKSAAQLCLRWAFQKGVAMIPKTANPSRLAENMDLFDFQLSEEEMKRIDKIPYCGGLGIDSDEVTEFG